LVDSSGHLSTVDWAQGRESSPDKDRHPNHCATPPTTSFLLLAIVFVVVVVIILFDCRLPFETVLMCSLPRESRLCFTLIGVRVVQSTTASNEGSQKINVPLGWVTAQLYSQQL